YELLSRRRPFEAKSTAEVISAILTAEPPPITRPGFGHVGGGVERLVRKCLQKDASLRYQAMGDLISDLAQIRLAYDDSWVRPMTETANAKPTATLARLDRKWS